MRQALGILATATLTLSLLFTPAPSAAVCTGDCNPTDGEVAIDELITMVNIALGNTPVAACLAGDANGDGDVTIDEIIQAVGFALNACPSVSTATATASATVSPTPKPTSTLTPTRSTTPTPTLTRSVSPTMTNVPTPTTPAAARCGDGVLTSPEECDPPADSACAGKCLQNCSCPPILSLFSPMSGPTGTTVTISGAGFSAVTGVSFNGVATTFRVVAPNQITTTVPSGATSGPITINAPAGNLVSSSSFSVLTPSTFSVSLVPANATVLQGQSTAYAVKLISSDGFSRLASLQVLDLPADLTATITPAQVTAGQTAIVKITAAAGQATGNVHFTVSASASVLGTMTTRSAVAMLSVQPVTTSFLGRTVEGDTMETPLAGVTIRFLGMAPNGHATDCVGYQTVSDAAGNFAFTNLPDECAGPQLIRYDGTTATSPPGQHAGVDLVYEIVPHQVVVSPVLVHLPRIEGQETVMVKQNFPIDQTFTFKTIPSLSLTVYAGTVLSLQDGTQPDPFPLTAVQVPVDRLPEEFSPQAQSGSKLLVFIVAFQPANASASQPVAVTFPNSLNSPPGTSITLFTLDPTQGQMVPYGTGKVSNDGTQILPDADSAHPGHKYGLTHFDWHGPTAPPPNGINPSPDPNGPKTCNPVDLSSGLEVITATDLAINDRRGPIGIKRSYGSGSNNAGPFGIGTSHNYGFQLNIVVPFTPAQGVVGLVMPDGNQFPLNQQGDGTYTNSTVPLLRGAVLSVGGGGTFSLRWKDGTVFGFQTFGRLTGLVSITDANGNVVSLVHGSDATQITQVVDPSGRALTLSYDNANRITSIVDPIGRKVQYSYYSQGTLKTVTDPAGGVSTYTYDTQNRLTQVVDPRGITTEQNTYDQNGRVRQQTLADGTLNFEYTLLNPAAAAVSPILQTKLTDPRGNTTVYHFNPQGFLIDATDALGQTQVFEREPGTNQLMAIHGTASCNVCGAGPGDVTFTRDAFGNVMTRTDALGATTSFTYDPIFNKVTSITDPLGHVSTLAYDARGNLQTVADPGGATTTFAYDATGLLTSVTDALGNVRQFGYDGLGNLTSIVDPLGNASTLTYDAVARVTTATDARGRSTQIAYDNLDRIREMVDAANGKTQFSYDANGNLVSLVDALGHQTAYEYDNSNRLRKRTDALGATESFEYDKSSNLVRRVDRKGQQSTFTADALNRLIQANFADGSSTSFVYDARSQLVQAGDSAGGVIHRSYDLVNRLVEEASPSGVVDYAYDLAGRRTTMIASGQPSVQYSYDTNSRVTSIAQGNQLVGFEYDLLGRRRMLMLPNGISAEYAYDTASQLTQLAYRNGNSMLGDLRYSYDAAGNRVGIDGSFARTSLPDPVAAASTKYDDANRQRQFGDHMMDFDANGNLTSIRDSASETALTWDARDRLVGFASRTVQASFVYDALGRRLQKTINGTTTQFAYDGIDISETIRNGLSVGILQGTATDEPLVRGGSEYYVADALGSTLGLADRTGVVQEQYTFGPFGETQVSPSVSDNALAFTGREYDETGLYFNRTRFYSPTLGRFISEDRVGFLGGGANLYGYALNNPVNLTDPSGQNPLLIVAGIGAIAGAISEGYDAYKCGHRFDAAFAQAVLRGAVAGAASAVVSVAVAVFSKSPTLSGAAGGLSYDVTANLLGGHKTVQDILIDTAAGAALGGFKVAETATEVVGASVPVGGNNFNPLTSPRTWGVKAKELYVQQIIGSAIDIGRPLYVHAVTGEQ
ncbi:MAG: hypothetical protein HY270_14580 [Deltaproteobacteria bacterium]|nr:hypothetical protein [Deltaproteobacteria bacterium]